AVELESDEQIDALCAGKIEVAGYVIAHPIAVVQEAISRCDVKLLEIDPRLVSKLLAANPHLSAMTIPAGLYAGQAKPVSTFGMKALLVTTVHLPQMAAEAIVSGVIDNFERFQHLHPVIETIGRDELSSSEPLVPLHEGARKVYRERRLLKK
ncbi:MAG: TAXI family TRAP transporter solute-binding subunit, partial [Rhodospirillales bacterium]